MHNYHIYLYYNVKGTYICTTLQPGMEIYIKSLVASDKHCSPGEGRFVIFMPTAVCSYLGFQVVPRPARDGQWGVLSFYSVCTLPQGTHES